MRKLRQCRGLGRPWAWGRTVVLNALGIVHSFCAFCQTDACRGRNAKCVWEDVIPLWGILSPAKAMNARAVNSPSIAILIGFMSSLVVAVTVYAQWIVAAESTSSKRMMPKHRKTARLVYCFSLPRALDVATV